MSSTPVEQGAGPVRRVRHQARDAIVVMAFSAAVSVGLAIAVVLLSHVGHVGR